MLLGAAVVAPIFFSYLSNNEQRKDRIIILKYSVALNDQWSDQPVVDLQGHNPTLIVQ
jgi:hypothetical protein